MSDLDELRKQVKYLEARVKALEQRFGAWDDDPEFLCMNEKVGRVRCRMPCEGCIDRQAEDAA